MPNMGTRQDCNACFHVAGGSNNNGRLFEEQEINQHLTKVIVRLQKDLEKVVKSVDLIEQRIGQLQGKVINL